MAFESACYFTGARKMRRNQCTRETVQLYFLFEMDCNHDITHDITCRIFNMHCRASSASAYIPLRMRPFPLFVLDFDWFETKLKVITRPEIPDSRFIVYAFKRRFVPV
jgi:hypothetical protein